MPAQGKRSAALGADIAGGEALKGRNNRERLNCCFGYPAAAPMSLDESLPSGQSSITPSAPAAAKVYPSGENRKNCAAGNPLATNVLGKGWACAPPPAVATTAIATNRNGLAQGIRRMSIPFLFGVTAEPGSVPSGDCSVTVSP